MPEDTNLGEKTPEFLKQVKPDAGRKVQPLFGPKVKPVFGPKMKPKCVTFRTFRLFPLALKPLPASLLGQKLASLLSPL